MPDWALMKSTGSIDYANGRGEMVIKGKSDSAPEARALFVGRDSYLGVKVGDTMYWMKESIDDTRGADRFMPGPSGTSPGPPAEGSDQVEQEGREARKRGDPRSHHDALPSAPRQDQAPERRQRRTSRASSTRGSTSRGSRDAFEFPYGGENELGGCGRPVRFRCPGRRRGAACERDRLRGQVRQAHGEGMRR